MNHHRLEAGGFGSRLKARLCFACSAIVHPEIVVVPGYLLRPDVLHGYLAGHVTRARNEQHQAGDWLIDTRSGAP